MNYLKTSACVLLLALPIMCSFAEIVGKGILVAKVLENGKPKYVIGNVTNRKPPLEVFLKSAHVITNLTGAAQWVAKTNLKSVTVIVATPEMFNPAATNVLALSAEEWETIFRRKPDGAGRGGAPAGNVPKN